jgi:RsiW-degrading membrane proteinase PrsW (M82 family)
MEYLQYISIPIPIIIALVIYFSVRGRKDTPYQNLLLRSYFFGMISIAIVLLVQLLASYFQLDDLRNLRRILFYSLVIVAFFSEISKFFFLKIFCYPDKGFRSPLDGIIFSVMIAMGFATLNNILTLVNIPNLSVSNINALTSGPANIIFGGLMGFFIGLGKTRKMRWIDSMTGLFAAIFFHALYAFTLITEDYKLLIAFFIGSTIILVSLWIASLRMDTDIRMNEQR